MHGHFPIFGGTRSSSPPKSKPMNKALQIFILQLGDKRIFY